MKYRVRKQFLTGAPILQHENAYRLSGWEDAKFAPAEFTIVPVREPKPSVEKTETAPESAAK
jgi:hypothetical protein